MGLTQEGSKFIHNLSFTPFIARAGTLGTERPAFKSRRQPWLTKQLPEPPFLRTRS